MLLASLWNILVTSLVKVLHVSCKLFTMFRKSRASISSSFASLICNKVTVRIALQKDAQSVCVVPIIFRNALGMAFRVLLISRLSVSGIAAARLSILFAHTMCAYSSIPCVFTRVPSSSSVIVVCSSSVSFSPTVFAVGVLTGHLTLNAWQKWSQLSFLVAGSSSHHCSAAAPDFR